MSEKLYGASAIKNILVYGWYFHGNLGDDLFIDAFKQLFPNYNFIFRNTLTLKDLYNVDAVFIGGGSLLENRLDTDDETFCELQKHKILYIGVGTETNIHSQHQLLMRRAQLIAIRSPSSINKITSLNSSVIVIPDLVHCLPPCQSSFKMKHSVLIIPNISLVPKWNDAHWKHVSWDYFKTEFAQFLDQLVNTGHTINFLPMCSSDELDDNNAACEIINKMTRRSNAYLLTRRNNYKAATECISQYEVVISQRYHGIVLANMTQVPCLIIHHHDKLKNMLGSSVPYYGLSKSILMNSLIETINSKIDLNLPIDRNMFTELIRKVNDALCRS